MILLLLAVPTFHHDVEPVLQRHCQTCHRPGAIAPMPLITYEQVRPWARAIREKVLLGKMPPWFAASGGPFANDPRLSDASKRTFSLWADDKAPEGPAADAPPPLEWPDGWRIGKPDLVAGMNEPFAVPARGDVDYQFIVVKLGLPEDRWIERVEVRPSNHRVVHHAVVYVRERGDPWPENGRRVTTNDILAVYTPGQPPFEARPGMAKFVPAGADLVLQMHYQTIGELVRDQTRIGIVFARQVPEKRVLTLQLNNSTFHIPPGERNYRVTASGTLPNDALLLSMFPHMHLRGAAFDYEIDLGEGRVETLLRVAPYDYYWQLNYILATPRLLKKGTRLRATGWYDNSPNNPRNPDPEAEVTYGEQSHDEMMIGFFDVAVPRDFDKRRFFAR